VAECLLCKREALSSNRSCGPPPKIITININRIISVPPVPSDPCENNPCLHGGTCNANSTTYGCRCGQGFAGENCEMGQCSRPRMGTCYRLILSVGAVYPGDPGDSGLSTQRKALSHPHFFFFFFLAQQNQLK
jgi:hypothetical protein